MKKCIDTIRKLADMLEQDYDGNLVKVTNEMEQAVHQLRSKIDYEESRHPADSLEIGNFCWCGWHRGGPLFILDRTGISRLWDIVFRKPKHERESRLAAFRPVLHPERLPTEVQRVSSILSNCRQRNVFTLEDVTSALAQLEWSRVIVLNRPMLLAQYREEWPEAATLCDDNGNLVFEKTFNRSCWYRYRRKVRC